MTQSYAEFAPTNEQDIVEVASYIAMLLKISKIKNTWEKKSISGVKPHLHTFIRLTENRKLLPTLDPKELQKHTSLSQISARLKLASGHGRIAVQHLEVAAQQVREAGPYLKTIEEMDSFMFDQQVPKIILSSKNSTDNAIPLVDLFDLVRTEYAIWLPTLTDIAESAYAEPSLASNNRDSLPVAPPFLS